MATAQQFTDLLARLAEPQNHGFLVLDRNAGFRCEGLSLRYLFIDGQWRDHERWAITEEDLARSP